MQISAQLRQPAQRKPKIATSVQSPGLKIGIVIAASVLLLAILAPHIVPYDIAKIAPRERLEAPSLAHPFGTDLYGRDLFSRVLYGTRLSVGAAVATVLFAAVPGIALGILAGLYPGIVADIISRITDAWMAVPGLLLAIAMVASFGRSPLVLAFALGIAGIPTYYRQARIETMRVRGELFVEAARTLGAKENQVLLYHVLPHVLPLLLVLIFLRTGGMLLAFSALSFIGLGAQPPAPEWGALLAEGRDYVEQAWWLTFFPGCAIAITVFGFNLIGDAFRDVLDPRRM